MSCLLCYGETIFLQGVTDQELADLSRLTGFERSNRPIDQASLGGFTIRAKDGLFGLSGDGGMQVDSQSLELLAEIIKGRILLKICAAKPELLFLRADVVKLADGSAGLFAGPSISGKTRLARAFIEQGASPWSTDAAVLTPEGELLPYPSSDLPVGGPIASIVAVIPYEGQASWEPQFLSPGQIVLQLTATVITSSEMRGDAFARLGQLATRAQIRCGGRRGDAAQAVNQLTTAQ